MRRISLLPYIKANGIELYYEDRGRGMPVLFIHGGFGGVESTLYPKPSVIHDVLPEDSFRTISYDRRNSGRSEYVTDEFRLEDLSDDARELLNALGIERAIVVGDSLGGMIAQQFALDHPGRTESLVLLETGSHMLRRTRQVSAILFALKLLGPRVMFRRFKHRFLNPDWNKPVGPRKSPEEMQALAQRHEQLVRRLHEMPEDELYSYSLGLIRTYVAYSGRDLSLKLYGLRTPSYVVHGTHDSIVPVEQGRAMSARIPGSRLIELPGLDHGLLYYDEARRVVREILERHLDPDGSADEAVSRVR